MTTPALDLAPDLPDDDDGAAGAAAGPGSCTRNSWCLSPAGHRGGCRKYPEGDPRSKRGGSSSSRASSSSRPSGSGSSSAAPPRSRRTSKTSSVMPALWSMIYGTIGQTVEVQAPEPAGPPVGRVMQFQAPLAGERIHQLANRVPVYRQATALAGGGIVDDLLELLAAPLLVGVMASSEQARMTLWPVLAGSLQSSAVQLAKMQREQQQAMRDVDEFTAEAQAIMEQLADSLFAPRPTHDDAGQ